MDYISERKLGHTEAHREFINWFRSGHYDRALARYGIDWRSTSYEPCDTDCVSLWNHYGIYCVKINISGHDYHMGVGRDVSEGYSVFRSAIGEIDYCYSHDMTKDELARWIRKKAK